MIVLRMPNGSVAVAQGDDGTAISARLGALAWRQITKLPDAPQERWEWTDQGPITIRRIPVGEKREATFLPRAQFLKACVRAGIITAKIAEEASSGQWPVAFDTFIEGLTSDQRIEARATWTDGKTVWRTDKILTLIAADLGVSDEQLDILFKIV